MKSSSYFYAGVVAVAALNVSAHDYETKRADSHAPIAVMGDHTHKTGEIMLSYRYMQMNMSGLATGEDSLSTSELFSQGYSVYAADMDMQMHMIGAMYAPSDKLTLMSMLMYNRNTMDGTMKMDSMGEGMQMPKMMKHSMESDGLGDLRLSGLYQIADLGHARIHLNLGVSVPTGSTDEKNNGMLLAYPMQLGSGTWDLLPGVTYNAQNEDLSWGAQLTGTFRTGDNNGYSLGHAGRAQAWVAKNWAPTMSTSLRINNEVWGCVDGEDLRLSMAKMKNPLANADLQGGFRSELGIGVNYYHQGGTLSGHRLAAEFIFPIHEDFEGIQMERDWSLVLGWQYAF
jgi:hypothetical protein